MHTSDNLGFISDPKFEAFLETAPDAIVVVNPLGQIVMLNQLTEQMFEYSRQEMLGHQIEILVPERFHGNHVQYRNGYFMNPRTRPMGEGRELAGRKKSGQEFPIEISLSPMETESGKLVISIIRDISPRKQLEAKFRGLLESAPDGIVVVDKDGKIQIVNSQVCHLFGYTKDELLGQPVELLVPQQFRASHIDYRSSYTQNPRTRPMGAGRALAGCKKDGTEFPVEISLSPLETEHGILITSIIRDITDRRHAEEQIQATLREKEALLKEIHHRVKNNLQVTSSLLRLQSESIKDDKARWMFMESQNRIRSMALVHEKLYQSTDLSKIHFSDYLKSLSRLLFRSFGVGDHNINFMINGSVVYLSIETAIPCGLIVNELLSNCLKHAFPEDRLGKIEVVIDSQNKRVSVSVCDDGVGLPENFDLNKTETLGLQLVNTLVKQLNGKIEVRANKGTCFHFSFFEDRGHHEA